MDWDTCFQVFAGVVVIALAIGVFGFALGYGIKLGLGMLCA